MSRSKLTNKPEELEKLLRKYQTLEPAYRWVEQNQDLLTAPIHVEEYPREDNDCTTFVPVFVVDNNDDYRMLYSNVREKNGDVINILQRDGSQSHPNPDEELAAPCLLATMPERSVPANKESSSSSSSSSSSEDDAAHQSSAGTTKMAASKMTATTKKRHARKSSSSSLDDAAFSEWVASKKRKKKTRARKNPPGKNLLSDHRSSSMAAASLAPFTVEDDKPPAKNPPPPRDMTFRQSSSGDELIESGNEITVIDRNTVGNTDKYKRRCVDQYTSESGMSEKWLKLMTFGSTNSELKDVYQGSAFDELKSGEKTKFTIGRNDLMEEINRRSHFLDFDFSAVEKKNVIFNGSKGTRPRPNGWTVDKMMSWLNRPHHYINTDEDESFLVSQLQVVAHRVAEISAPLEVIGTVESKWMDQTSWSWTQQCRLVHAVLHDSLRTDYLTRKVALTRQEIDARGTDAAGERYWDKVARLFKDADFKPTSTVILDDDWGNYWVESHNLFPLHDAHENISAETVERKYRLLISVVKKVRANFMQSGNGQDQEGMNGKGSKKSDFLGSKKAKYIYCHPEVALYLWYHLESYELLEASLNQLPDRLVATGRAQVTIDGHSTDDSASSGAFKSRRKKAYIDARYEELLEEKREDRKVSNRLLDELQLLGARQAVTHASEALSQHKDRIEEVSQHIFILREKELQYNESADAAASEVIRSRYTKMAAAVGVELTRTEAYLSALEDGTAEKEQELDREKLELQILKNGGNLETPKKDNRSTTRGPSSRDSTVPRSIHGTSLFQDE